MLVYTVDVLISIDLNVEGQTFLIEEKKLQDNSFKGV